jgi:hypothetical protein
VRQQQLEALIAGDGDGRVEDCQASARIVAQVRERKEDPRTLHVLVPHGLVQRRIAKITSIPGIRAGGQEQLDAVQAAALSRSIQGSAATRVDCVAVCASV